MKKIVFFTICICIFVVTTFGDVYKWVDEGGNIHYGDKPPEQEKTQKIDIKPAPSMPKSNLTQDQLDKSRIQSFKGQSVSLKDLGPLPKNSSSSYLTTKSSGVVISKWKEGTAKYIITLTAGPGLPVRAYLEAHFDNPENPDTSLVAGVSRELGDRDISIMSPEFKGLKCWNYQAVVYVYSDSTKSQLIGTHNQAIQSRLNFDKVKPLTLMNVLEAIRDGNCP